MSGKPANIPKRKPNQIAENFLTEEIEKNLLRKSSWKTCLNVYGSWRDLVGLGQLGDVISQVNALVR